MESGLNTSDIAVVVVAYRRPEFTEAAVSRALEFDSSVPVVISVDGLRSDASADEEKWRNEVLSRSRALSSKHSRVRVIAWKTNSGLIGHSLRFQRVVFAVFERAIILEEDQVLSNEGFKFLEDNVLCGPKPSQAVAYAPYSHPEGKFRFTHFPHLWGICYNRAFYLEILKSFELNFIETNLVLERVTSSLGTGNTRSRRVSDYWTSLFNEAITSDFHMDAMKMYTSIRINSPWICSAKNFLRDIGHLDSRGLNPRKPKDARDGVCRDLIEHGSCRTCDRKSARLALASFPYFYYEQAYRFLTLRFPWLLGAIRRAIQ